MPPRLSQRLQDIVDSLPLRPGLRVIEVGCGPGAMAREMARKVFPNGAVLGIDRSAKAIRQAEAGMSAEEVPGLSFQQTEIENFVLKPGEELFDLAVAVRVGTLDGRHPEAADQALAAIAAALRPNGRLFIDGREVAIGLTSPAADGSPD
ncbi:hypothetical protein Pan44_27790 [Caulifigura coniformis]|uniref:Methyltransferase domain-containing protein n=1 Tax=Caulifigura coniformis TaxID=2527983 RepID=A0A517SF35_9PLAN|nr:methyltransferase domain-containing protein [Caulifigura coniformis]QDT54743.1 hypothetical protein Pan44_27790 [Caulifigura coniformis]